VTTSTSNSQTQSADADGEVVNPIDAPNTLITYKGGGYSGCVWEWNFAYIDRMGQFHDIYSSGVMGCPTFKKLEEQYARRPRDFDVYAFDRPEECKAFVDNEAIHWVLGVAQWFASMHFPDPPAIKETCPECGQEYNLISASTDPDESNFVGTKVGCAGGVELQFKAFVCRECFESHTCSRCHEYVGPDGFDNDKYGDGDCIECHEHS
jgi:hypothetical protein